MTNNVFGINASLVLLFEFILKQLHTRTEKCIHFISLFISLTGITPTKYNTFQQSISKYISYISFIVNYMIGVFKQHSID
jgi:hypothetical protein